MIPAPDFDLLAQAGCLEDTPVQMLTWYAPLTETDRAVASTPLPEYVGRLRAHISAFMEATAAVHAEYLKHGYKHFHEVYPEEISPLVKSLFGLFHVSWAIRNGEF